MQWKLLRLRKENGFSQEELAKLLNVSAKTYGTKERGTASFDSDEMFALSKLFKVPMDDIFLPRSNQNGNKIKSGG